MTAPAQTARITSRSLFNANSNERNTTFRKTSVSRTSAGMSAESQYPASVPMQPMMMQSPATGQ